MEELAKSKNTPGTDAAFDLLGRVAVDPESEQRYPSGTVLIPADSPDASKLISRAIDERKPIAIVFPDGSDVVARPPAATGAALLVVLSLLWLADQLRRKRCHAEGRGFESRRSRSNVRAIELRIPSGPRILPRPAIQRLRSVGSSWAERRR